MNALAVQTSLETVAGGLFPRHLLSLAQLPYPTEHDVFVALTIVCALLGVIALWRKAFPPRKPALEVEFSTKVEMAEMRTEILAQVGYLDEKIESMRQEFREEINSVQRSGEARASGLHNRMNDLAAMLNDIGGQLKLLINPPRRPSS